MKYIEFLFKYNILNFLLNYILIIFIYMKFIDIIK